MKILFVVSLVSFLFVQVAFSQGKVHSEINTPIQNLMLSGNRTERFIWNPIPNSQEWRYDSYIVNIRNQENYTGQDIPVRRGTSVTVAGMRETDTYYVTVRAVCTNLLTHVSGIEGPESDMLVVQAVPRIKFQGLAYLPLPDMDPSHYGYVDVLDYYVSGENDIRFDSQRIHIRNPNEDQIAAYLLHEYGDPSTWDRSEKICISIDVSSPWAFKTVFQCSTDLIHWTTVEPEQITRGGDVTNYWWTKKENVPCKFYRASLVSTDERAVTLGSAM